MDVVLTQAPLTFEQAAEKVLFGGPSAHGMERAAKNMVFMNGGPFVN